MLSFIQKQREHEAAFVSLRTLLSELAEMGGVSIKEAALLIHNEIERSITRPMIYDYLEGTRLYSPANDHHAEYLFSIACDDFVVSDGWSELLDGSAYKREEFANWFRLVAPNDPLPSCLEIALTKVRVTAGTIESGGKRYAVGDTLNTTAAEAERLIGKGVAKRAEPQPADQSARIHALEQALAAAEARATAAERERDELRERLAAIERQGAERPALDFLHPSARLLWLVAEVQREFWPDWKPGDGGNGRQDAALQWLTERHGLSRAEAQAVERVAAPISRDPAKKNPQG